MHAPHAPLLRIETVGRVRRIVLSEGPRRNLLTLPMIAALNDALDAPEARVIIIAAEGPAFCAGHDLKAMREHLQDDDAGADAFKHLFSVCSAMMAKIADIPQTVIAEVQATAVAAGCQLVAACDLAVAADTARFGTTGVRFGLFCSTPAVPLTRTIAPKHAAEMLYSGALIDATHAARIGLINRAVPPDQLTGETMALAAQIAENSAAVLALGKRTLAAQRGLPLAEAYECATDAMVDNLVLNDGREGLAAFVEKRPGQWTDQ